MGFHKAEVIEQIQCPTDTYNMVGMGQNRGKGDYMIYSKFCCRQCCTNQQIGLVNIGYIGLLYFENSDNYMGPKKHLWPDTQIYFMGEGGVTHPDGHVEIQNFWSLFGLVFEFWSHCTNGNHQMPLFLPPRVGNPSGGEGEDGDRQ